MNKTAVQVMLGLSYFHGSRFLSDNDDVALLNTDVTQEVSPATDFN